ncbi:alpha/beta hydrolase [Bacillus horti]|uniref:Carboxylesterase n=2 Tax=Caldalkalibacillus horti TaxID=77523 RepID=A0ABT9W397_9BACI|nr:carboxylesterase [Bacillus horti]
MEKPTSFTYRGDRQIGVLLIHGFSGSTKELTGLGRILHEQGLTVHAPLLKGHGLTPEEMGKTTWVDWWGSVKEGYQQLVREGCTSIFVIGHSMGGLLALKLAQYEKIEGIVTLCAAMKVRDKRFAIVSLLQHMIPYKRRKKPKADYIERELYIYDRVPLKCIVSLHKLITNVQKMVHYVKQPILIIQSDLDETVDPLSGNILYQRVGSEEKELVTFKDSTHMITLDLEKEMVFDRVQKFLLDRIEKKVSLLNVQ